MLALETSVMAIAVSRQVVSVLSCNTISGRFVSTVQPVITGMSYITGLLLTFVTLSGLCS